MFSVSAMLYIFNPVWATLLALICLTCLALWLPRTGLWARYRYWVLATLVALYAIDTAVALPRILFSYSLSNQPVVAQKIPLPRQLVLVDIPCSAKCHEMLISGAVDEVIFVGASGLRREERVHPVRYRVGWSIPGACPYERQKVTDYQSDLLKTGYCPLVEPADLPSQGIFLIREATIVVASERARAFTPTYLVKRPPGPVIQFAGIEVQARNAAGVTVLASTYEYKAPGLLGLPPMIGCWERPDNVIWIMPPGDTGCGFWRWFTWGGDEKTRASSSKWFFDDVFGPPDRPYAPPKRPDLPPPTPAQALEILSSASVEYYLPGLREALLASANTDQALADLVVKLARRESLEGSLLALLANNRPGALVGISKRLNPVPIAFVNSGVVLDAMEKDSRVRDELADTLFLALAADWGRKSPNVGRFLKLMEGSHPGWLCARLDRLSGPDGILAARKSRAMKNFRELVPPFIPLIVEKTAQSCPDQTAGLMREFPP